MENQTGPISSAQPTPPLLVPNMVILSAGSVVVAMLSFGFLVWPFAIASTILGIMLVASADIDARTMLLPDSLTLGAIILGLIVAFTFAAGFEGQCVKMGAALMRGGVTTLLLALSRKAYAYFRGQEGIGFGDVKLGAAIGVWLPAEQISNCFLLASIAALLFVTLRPAKTERLTKLPFGTFLCPALWLLVFIDFLPQD